MYTGFPRFVICFGTSFSSPFCSLAGPDAWQPTCSQEVAHPGPAPPARRVSQWLSALVPCPALGLLDVEVEEVVGFQLAAQTEMALFLGGTEDTVCTLK